jgi:uncharacterized SAM-binding protein YcdF (DUF218 family)
MLDAGWQRLIAELLLPPGGILLLTLVALVLWPRRLGRSILGLAALATYALATPAVGGLLLWSLGGGPVVNPAAHADVPGTAIVILSGDLQRDAPEYGGDTTGALTLERLRYGARLAKATHLPVLVSGGIVEDRTAALAELMRDALERDFGVVPRWLEDRSRTTWENAAFSAELLRRDGISRILLVTHGWHMRRSVIAFAQTGLETIPAPTLSPSLPGFRASDFMPTANAFHRSYFALHEILGLAWYRFRALF